MTDEIILVPGAKVQLEGRFNHREGTTDQKGKLTLNKLLPDIYTLIIVKEGYQTYTHPEPIIIKENKVSHAKLHVVLQRNTRTITVKLTPQLADTSISLTSSDNKKSTSKTDATGSATFENVLYGSYTLKVNKEGYYEYTQEISVNKTNNNPRIIEVTLQETDVPDESEDESD